MRQQPGTADIRKEAEADFGHRELRLLGHNTVATVRRQADAAAHHDAIHEGDIRLREFLDAGVEDVLVAPQDLAEIALDLRAFPERADVTAGAEAAFARTFQHNDRNIGINLERVERLVDVVEHLQRHGIDGFRPVQADDAGRAFLARDQVSFCNGNIRHRAPSISLRDTISRMISLVPSRIWCTRRSRTIFSMPYSLR